MKLAAYLALVAAPVMAAPAEPPPPGYAGRTYVDSAGCAFQRAEIGGRTIWAEWLGPDGRQVCGDAASVPAPALSDALPAIPPHRRGAGPGFPEPGTYVQVAAFRRTATADAAAARLQAAGLPLLRQDFRTGGGLRILYAGPLGAGEPADGALRTVHDMGWRDAFLWTQD